MNIHRLLILISPGVIAIVKSISDHSLLEEKAGQELYRSLSLAC